MISIIAIIYQIASQINVNTHTWLTFDFCAIYKLTLHTYVCEKLLQQEKTPEATRALATKKVPDRVVDINIFQTHWHF